MLTISLDNLFFSRNEQREGEIVIRQRPIHRKDTHDEFVASIKLDKLKEVIEYFEINK